MKTLGKIRKKLKLSCAEMARELGKTLHSYLDCESYARKIDTRDLKKIRALAKKAGLTDKMLLDALSSEKPPKRVKGAINAPTDTDETDEVCLY